MEFHEILRNLIEDSDITQKQLANNMHIPPSTIGGYVQGTSEPDFGTLKIFADYFNVSTDYLLDVHHSNGTNNYSENELLRIYRALDCSDQRLLIELGKTILKRK